MAFDLLWVDGEDLRFLPLADRKLRLWSVVPQGVERFLYCDHVEQDGEGLFRLACGHDLEGIVAKHKHDAYLPEHARWLKIRNREYSDRCAANQRHDEMYANNPLFQLWKRYGV